MVLWQILGITIAAISVSIGILCVLARFAVEGYEDESGFNYGKLPNNFPDRARSLPTGAARPVDVRSHVIDGDTYPASLLGNPFHVSGGMR